MSANNIKLGFWAYATFHVRKQGEFTVVDANHSMHLLGMDV